MTKPMKQAIETLAKEMFEDRIRSRPGRYVWETAAKSTKAAYLNYARLVLEDPKTSLRSP